MISKYLILVASFLALVACQSGSTCDSTSFNFYNGFNINGSITEHTWDWSGYYFDDGTSDTFDSYFYLDLLIDNVTYSMSEIYDNYVDYICDVGTTDIDSASYASYTFNITDTIQLHREFYAPRAATWLRVVDTIRNFGPEKVTLSLNYYGNYGSDGNTQFTELNDYFWVSSDGENGDNDTPFSVNAASAGALIIPTRQAGYFVTGNDETSFTYENVEVPVGEARSIMVILGQYGNLSDAVAGVKHINSMPEEIFANLAATFETIVNWALCTVQFKVMNSQTTFCETPIALTFTASGVPTTLTFNDSPVTLTDGQFTVSVVHGTNKITYHRQVSDCVARNATFNFKLPSANLSLAVDTSGSLPSVSASGGYGTYKYSWQFSSGGDLTQVFGGKATVTVSDKEGCTKSAEIDVPQTAGKVSHASTIAASILCLTALVVMF